MSTHERAGGRQAVLFARDDLPRPAEKRRTAIEHELARLATDASLSSFDVVAWQKRVPVSGERERPEQTYYEQFREWAEARDASLSPYFDTRLCYSATTGEKRTDLVVPALCLVIYEDDELIEVAPHSRGTERVTVEDAIRSLRDATDDEPVEAPAVEPAD